MIIVDNPYPLQVAPRALGMNSAKSLAPFREQTDMGFWDKSLRIFKCLCEHGRQGVRHMAQQTGLSKSSVHRLTQAMERRGRHPESWLWETEEGRQWLTPPGRGHALYVWPQARRGDGHDERVFRASAS